jgi:hypothetical protein
MPTASRVVILLLVCGWSPHPQAKENPPIIKTEQGSLRGKRVGRANVFLGIPYAKEDVCPADTFAAQAPLFGFNDWRVFLGLRVGTPSAHKQQDNNPAGSRHSHGKVFMCSGSIAAWPTLPPSPVFVDKLG